MSDAATASTPPIPPSVPPVGPPGKPAPAPQSPWLRAWPIYLLTLAVIGGTVYFVRNRTAGTGDTILPPVVKLEHNIEIQFQDVIMQGRQKGVQRWVITAPKVSLSRDGRYTYFEPNPEGSFVNLKDWTQKDGEPTPTPEQQKNRSLRWKADKARFDSFTEDLEIDGKAIITTDKQDIIKTERVEYKSRTKQVVMPQPVTVKMKDGTDIKADALSANTDAEVFELRGHVKFDTKVGDDNKM